MEGACGLREVIPNQSVPPPVREFMVSTGGTQSTLQVSSSICELLESFA